jgi:hypothetical protein
MNHYRPHDKSSQFVFTSRCLITDPSNVLFSCRCRLTTISHPIHCSIILSDEKMGLSFTTVRTRRRSHSRVRFPWDSSPYFTAPETGWSSYKPWHWALFSSPPMTRRVTMEVFEPAFKRGYLTKSTRRLLRLGAKPLGTHDQSLSQLNPCDHSSYAISALVRG